MSPSVHSVSPGVGNDLLAVGGNSSLGLALEQKITAENLVLVTTIDIMWVLLCSFLVISMQLGFAMLEVGSCREAHRMTVLVKNVLDSAVSCIGFWVFVSQHHPSIIFDDNDRQQMHLTLFYLGFCATCVTICSGSMAERAHLFAYLCYAFVMSTVIFPPLAEGAWGREGTLLHLEFHGRFSTHDYHDFAGSGVVHVVGGVAALVGNCLLGRRILKSANAMEMLDSKKAKQFRDLEGLEEEPVLCPESGWKRRFDDMVLDQIELTPCHYLQAMGMFMLWVGWYGFNSGSAFLTVSGSCSLAGRVAWHTTLAGAGGGFGTFIYCYCVRKVLDVGFICNGVIGGLVAITAACDVTTEHASLALGLCVGLFFYPMASYALKLLRLDDPVDAIAVHLVSGIVGTLSVGFCRPDCERLFSEDPTLNNSSHAWVRFCAEDHSIAAQFVAQLWGLFTLSSVTGAACLVCFGVFAISEYCRSVEASFLAHADRLLCDMVSGTPESKFESECAQIADYSPVVKTLLIEHGWTGTCFQDGAPEDLWTLRSDIRAKRARHYETALEGESMTWHPLVRFGRMLGMRPWIRRVCLLRLRISPSAEASGLGAADADGGETLKAVMKALHSPQKRYEDQAASVAIESKVEELSAIVNSQDTLLRTLVRQQSASATIRSGNSRSKHPMSPGSSESQEPKPQLEHVPEENIGGIHVSLSANQEIIGPTPSVQSPSTPTLSTQGLLPFRMNGRAIPLSGSSVSTNSDQSTIPARSAGAITPCSNEEITPPPSIIGNTLACRRYRGQQNDAALQNLAAAAMQIARALESQQDLLARFERSGASPGGRSEDQGAGGRSARSASEGSDTTA